MLIQTLAVVSGAHFNPAVTVAMTALRQIKAPDAGIYILAQLAGGRGRRPGLTKLILVDEGASENYGATDGLAAARGRRPSRAWSCEALGTFFLLWAIIGVAVNPRATKDWAALAIGAALGMGVMVFAPLTGAGFNPARAFGPGRLGQGLRRRGHVPARLRARPRCWARWWPRSSTSRSSSRRARRARAALEPVG